MEILGLKIKKIVPQRKAGISNRNGYAAEFDDSPTDQIPHDLHITNIAPDSQAGAAVCTNILRRFDRQFFIHIIEQNGDTLQRQPTRYFKADAFTGTGYNGNLIFKGILYHIYSLRYHNRIILHS